MNMDNKDRDKEKEDSSPQEEFQDAFDTFQEPEPSEDKFQDVEGSGEEDETETVNEEKRLESERRAKEDKMSPEERNSLKEEALELKKKGNEAYLSGDNEAAFQLYTQAINICPLTFIEDRSYIYSNMAASRLKQDRKEEAKDLCSTAIELNPSYIKALARRATLNEELDRPHEAFEDAKKILELDPRHKESLSAIQRLPNKIKEKDEKMKAEMFDNLKKLGNMVLNPFGFSTENFKFTQDPNTGGYSVNFSK